MSTKLPWSTSTFLAMKFLSSTVITMGLSWSCSTPWKSASVNMIGGIRRRLCVQVTALMDWMLLRCLFLADVVASPPAKPPNMVFIVPHSGGRSTGLMLVCADGCSLRSFYLSLWSRWQSKSMLRLFTYRELPCLSLFTNCFKWPERMSYSILSCRALHSFVVWSLLWWYLQYLVMSALGGLRVLWDRRKRSVCRASSLGIESILGKVFSGF